ncbi:MAG: imidazoleglycerol-phosphate dehydratase HisB [Opitutales bacterium]|nr:imidazoleglycerol-phosphate dehydratase HisB [Opitutales bacterium]
MTNKKNNRKISIERNTKETQIKLSIDLDGEGKAEINTGIPFFDHMLNLFSRHGLFDLSVKAVGDIDVDYHHTVEDVGIVLGNAIKQALGNKVGINRYGFFILPMDESLARVAIDLSDRPYFVYDVSAKNMMIRDFNLCLVREFFQAVSNSLACNLHIKLEYGEEPHHIAEAIFKCFSKALMNACSLNERAKNILPSTKEKL